MPLLTSNATAIFKLKQQFPELSNKQFMSCLAYSIGMDANDIACISGNTYEAVKKQMQRSKIALNLDRLENIRAIFIMRTLWVLL
jgi:hypothetical protein